MKIFNKNEWKKVKLGDIFNLQMGKTPLRENKLYWNKGEYNWISISDMNFSEKYVSFTKEKITNLAVKESGIKIIPKNTVIMSFKLSIGKVKIVNDDIYSNEAIMAFIPKENIPIDKNFLYYSLKSIKWNEGINKAVKGLTLNKALISQKEIFLPNLAIQKEIASNLDSIADFLDLRRKQLNYLKELNKSLFTKYSNRKVSKSFYIKDISSELFAGGDKPNYYSENITKEYIYPVYSNGEKKEGLLCFSKTFKVDKEALTISARGTIGFTSIRKAYFTPVVRLITLIPNKNNNIIYLKYAIEKLNLKKLGSGVAQLTIPVFSKYKLNLPPIELQNKFAERIEKIEKLKFEIEKSIEMAQNLYNSLISKYFDN